jgi:ABC-type Fe3+/spermidine/putrescine transport system ATPase subunit
MLRLNALSRRFGDTIAVDGVSLEVRAGEFLTLLGPSGCGKTTTLRMIAGFEHPTSGQVWVDGRDVTTLPPQKRDVGMVFQNYALFPHMDVGENVAFGLRVRGGRDVDARVERALARVELSGYTRRKVQELSGGQQQRVALARALAPEPPLLLLDEPLSNLDAALRERTRTEIRALLKELGMTAVFVTHDQEEAFALSDRIAVLNRGTLQQLGTPEELYGRPVNPFVAAFLGRANFFPAVVESVDGDALLCRLPSGPLWRAAGAGGAGKPVRLMVRPEAMRLTDAADGVPARVLDRRFAGPTTFYRTELADGAEALVQGAPTDAAPGDTVRLALAPGAEAVAYPAEA